MPFITTAIVQPLSNQPFQVKKLIVTVQDPYSEKTDYFYVWEYVNGLIRVPSNNTNDYFFYNRDVIEPCGLDQIVSIEETGVIIETTRQNLREFWRGSCSEFGIDDDCLPLVKELVVNHG